MLGPFSFSGARSANPSIGTATRARGYARHYLWNAALFWGVGCLAGASGLAFLRFGRPLPGGVLLYYAAASLLAAVLVYSIWKVSCALMDLREEPLHFEGRVASRAARVFWTKLAFLEEKYYLEIVRGTGLRPLTLGTGRIVGEGWFLAAQGYHDLVVPGDRVSGTLYARTRLVATLLKV